MSERSGRPHAIDGLGVSPGIALGSALVVGRWEVDVQRYRIAAEGIRSELRRFWSARVQARKEIIALRERTADNLGSKYAAIFDAHRMILDDRKLGRETMQAISKRGINAEWALATTVNRLLEALAAVDDPYIRERGGDIQDVHVRLQRILSGGTGKRRELQLSEETIVVAHGLSPSDAIWLHQPRIVGFVTEEGGRTSHTAILANALEIPAVLGAKGATAAVHDGQRVVIDGGHGRIVIDPDPQTLEHYCREKDALSRQENEYEAESGPVSTSDGIALRVSANIEFPDEMATVERIGADGVGLYRSEFLFLTVSPSLPSQEDHAAAYRRIASACSSHPAIIRTLDLGGEKYFHKVLRSDEANPVLGLRAVRFCLAQPDIFKVQLRSLLAAATEFENIWILVPMISGLEEWRRVKELFHQTREEMRTEGIKVGEVPLGCMVEVPAAALVARHLAREADFLSIGTNDLIQYTVAIDRGNQSVAYLYDPWHPAVLSLISETILAAKEAEIPVSLCGEMGSDPLGSLTLLGLGLTHFSCNPLALPEIRSVLRRADAAEAAAVVRRARELADGASIKRYLFEHYRSLLEETIGSNLDGESGESLPSAESSG